MTARSVKSLAVPQSSRTLSVLLFDFSHRLSPSAGWERAQVRQLRHQLHHPISRFLRVVTVMISAMTMTDALITSLIFVSVRRPSVLHANFLQIRLLIHVARPLQLCMSQSAMQTADSGVLTDDQCLELGFRKSELQCFRCHDLARFELNELQESCLKCCQEKEEKGTPRVSSFDVHINTDPLISCRDCRSLFRSHSSFMMLFTCSSSF